MIESVHLQQLLNKSHENKLAHAFLLETNNINKCFNDILSLLKQLNCQNNYDINCSNECNMCKLIEMNNLPSLIIIEPDGQFIKKAQILEMMDKFSTRPIYSKYNMYVIKDADRFNASSANTLLKFLEEPEDNILGFFITTNKENVISTIRSRCQSINCIYKEELYFEKTDEYLDEVKIYLNEIYKNSDDLIYNKVHMSSLYKDRIEWEKFFLTMLSYVRDCYSNSNSYKIDFFKQCDIRQILEIINIIEDVLKHIKYNGNIDLILDKFVIEMRRCYG